MSINNIVVGYDGSSEADQALRWALVEAELTSTPIKLVYAWVWPTYLPAASLIPATSSWPDAETEQRIMSALTDAVGNARASHPDLRITSTIVQGPVPEAVLQQCHHADLVVIGGRGHSAVAGLLLGSVAGAVAAHAPCNVVVIRNAAISADERPIAVGLDDSSRADLTAEFAFTQAARRKVPLQAVRAWMPPPDPWIGAQHVDRAEVEASERAELTARLAPWREKFPDVPVTSTVVLGHPYQVLAEAARDAQLMVVGARGRGGFAALRVGSVSRYLLHHSPTSTAVVRET